MVFANEKEKNVFLNTLNKKGFILEDRSFRVISQSPYVELNSMRRNHAVDFERERVEFDILVESGGDKHFIIECKRTDYTWIFMKDKDRNDVLNIIYDSKKGIRVNSHTTGNFKSSYSYDIAIGLKEDGTLRRSDGELAQTSYKDVRDNVRQVLKQVGVYINTPLYDKKITPSDLIIPVVITNSPIYYLEYDVEDIKEDGDLKHYREIKDVGMVAYNFPEVIKWGSSRIFNDKDIGNNGDNLKTVFIVNIHKIKEFFKLMDLYPASTFTRNL